MGNKEINITYETLYEILKREKDMADLQKIDPDFFAHFIDYLNEKERMLGKEDALFSDDEKKKTEKQIENAKRLIKEIYERREKKVLGIALMKSRTKSNVIDTSSLLDNEKGLLDGVEGVLNSFRREIIDNILRGKPVSKSIKSAVKDAPKEKKADEEISAGIGSPAINNQNDNISEVSSKDTMLVRFLHPVPKFVGTELEEYGPFAEEDIANLPAEIAEALINKGRVEEIKDN